MELLSILFILKWASLAAALSLLAFKYWYALSLIKDKTVNAKSKWLGWYGQNELMAINCPRTWEIMQQNNRVTTALWICFAIFSVLLVSSI